MSYMGVCDLLHPSKATVCRKWLPAKTVRIIVLGRKQDVLSRRQNHADRLVRSHASCTVILFSGSKLLQTVLAVAMHHVQ